MGGLARLYSFAVLPCCGAVTLVNTLLSGHASCRSLSGVSRWSSRRVCLG